MLKKFGNMIIYRITKKMEYANDLSGREAFQEGGRWNNPGTFMLYTSASRSLALLEMLVHVDESELPPHMFIIQLELGREIHVYELPDGELPKDWMEVENITLKEIGDRLMAEKKYMAVKVRSAVMPYEYNYLLNPLFPGFYDKVKIKEVSELNIDKRIFKKQ
jgi:RES domain-containing protein